MVSRIAFAVAFLAISAFVLAEGDKEAPKVKNVYGQVSAVDGGKVTVKGRGEGGEVTSTFTVVEGTTKIQVATGEFEEVKGDNGAARKRPKFAEGKLEDLKVGVRVNAKVKEDGTALSVNVLPANTREGGDKPKIAPRQDAPKTDVPK